MFGDGLLVWAMEPLPSRGQVPPLWSLTNHRATPGLVSKLKYDFYIYEMTTIKSSDDFEIQKQMLMVTF